jgi:hypothetical protein
MATLSVSDWKTFLKARLLQEQGDDKQALSIFDDLLAKYPEDKHVKSSRAFALERLGRGDEAAATRIAVKYADLGRTLVGKSDKPEVWAEEINGILKDIESADVKGVATASALVAW